MYKLCQTAAVLDSFFYSNFQKLLETLNEVKTSSSQIDRSLYESAEIKRKLMGEYDQYKDVCNRAASLYVRINQIYAMPLNVFMSLYVKSISLEKV